MSVFSCCHGFPSLYPVIILRAATEYITILIGRIPKAKVVYKRMTQDSVADLPACLMKPSPVVCRKEIVHPSLAFPAASIYCRTALHLQLTTAIVSAATLHNNQPVHVRNGSHAEDPDSMGEAVLLEHNRNSLIGAPSTDMWQNVGAEAMHEAVTHAQQLTSSLQSIDVDSLTGEQQHRSCQQRLGHF